MKGMQTLFAVFESEAMRAVAAASLLIVCFGNAPAIGAATSAPKISMLSSDLVSPWGMAFLPDGRMLITAKGGVHGQ